jgi:RNA polymerase sigma-70 factor (ECF subfamily)
VSGNLDFKEIYEEFQPKIRHYLTELAGPTEAEDLTQEVFEKVSSALEGFRGESKLSTWLYRIATNTALDKLRSSSFRRASENTPLEGSAGVHDGNIWSGQKKTSTDQEFIRKEMSACVREYMEDLPPDYKAVIILSDFGGFKNGEIADILQVSLDTVKIRLHRARAALKKKLDDGCNFYRNEQNVLACDRKPASIKSKKSE